MFLCPYPSSSRPLWHFENDFEMDHPFAGLRSAFRDVERVSNYVDNLSRRMMAQPAALVRPNSLSQVVSDDKKFQVGLDVRDFKPEELEVKTFGDRLVVHGKHEEKQDKHGYVEREFTRTYWLPKGVNADQVKSNLSDDGVLTIHAPKMAIEKSKEKKIPIEYNK